MTVQIITFISALHYSKKLDKPALIVAPATLIAQWVKEFHRWWPALRVSILHSTGSGMLNNVEREADYEDDDRFFNESTQTEHRRSSQVVKKLVTILTVFSRSTALVLLHQLLRMENLVLFVWMRWSCQFA